MATITSTPISSKLYQVRVGGDVAVLKGMMKVLVEADDAALAADSRAILDWDFIHGHTHGHRGARRRSSRDTVGRHRTPVRTEHATTSNMRPMPT